MREKRRIRSAVVTGASSMIGAGLTKALLADGIRVYAVVRPGSKKTGNLPLQDPHLVLLASELQDLHALPPVPADAFFHFAWAGTLGEGRNDEALQRLNVRCSLDAVRKAKECGASAFLFAGSQAEYGPKNEVLREDTVLSPVTEYGKAKLSAETETRSLAASLSLNHIAVRVLSVFGPGDNAGTMIMQAIGALLRGEKPRFTKGEQLWDYLYVSDAAEAFKKLAYFGIDGEAYVLGGGKAEPLKNYILKLRDTVLPGAPLGIGEIPYKNDQPMMLSADITKLMKDTGFTPEVPFEEGILRTAAWYREKL